MGTAASTLTIQGATTIKQQESTLTGESPYSLSSCPSIKQAALLNGENATEFFLSHIKRMNH